MFNLNMTDQPKLAGVLSNCNMDAESWFPIKEYRSGDQITVYMPLVGTYINDHYFSNIQGDIVLDFVPANSIIAEAEDSGNVSVDCNDMSLIVETENFTAEDEKSHQVYHSQVISSNRVLEWVPVDEYSKTLTAGSNYNIDLDSVVGKCAGFVLIVRPTGATNANNKLFEYVDLGDTAQIDFITSGGKSILGSGVPVDAKYLRDEIWSTHFSTDFNRKRNASSSPSRAMPRVPSTALSTPTWLAGTQTPNQTRLCWRLRHPVRRPVLAVYRGPLPHVLPRRADRLLALQRHHQRHQDRTGSPQVVQGLRGAEPHRHCLRPATPPTP